jgi:hypothetical protein
MTSCRKMSVSDGASKHSKHGGGIRNIFDRFRTAKRQHVDISQNEFGSIVVEDMPPIMQDDHKFRSEREIRRREAKIGQLSKASTFETLSEGSSASASSSGFFNKLLHRPAKSNKKTSHPRTSQDSYSPRSGHSELSIDHIQQPHRKRRSVQRNAETTTKPLKRQLSRIDHKINYGDDRRQSQVYVPSYAMIDNSCTAANRSLRHRYSIIDEDEGRRLSLLLGGLSPPPRDTESCSPCSFLVDEVYRDKQRRLTIATLEGISNVDTDSSIGGNDGDLMDTLYPPPMDMLHPPPTPSFPPRRRSRQSYSKSEDRRHIFTAAESLEISDYQQFIQRALDQERWDQDQKRRGGGGITSHLGQRRSLTPVHPDLGNSHVCTLQRSGTFGGSRRESRRERSRSVMRDDAAGGGAAWKRASCYSYQSRDCTPRNNNSITTSHNKRPSYVGVEPTFEPGYTLPPPRDLRKSTSAAKRMSDYFRPHRDMINEYEMPDTERLSLSIFSVI